MDCERAVEALIDRAAGGLDEAHAAALITHLGTCGRCRAEALEIEGLWNDLGALRAAPDAAHTEHMARRLRGGRSRPSVTPPWLRAAVWAALLLGAGWIGRATAPAADASPSTAPGPEWLLLLHEDPVPTSPTPEVIAEYGAWASELASDGRLVLAEKLAGDPGMWLPGRPPQSRVTGFFIVRAGDEAEAAAVARSGPHLSYGGTVEVRRIDPRGGRP